MVTYSSGGDCVSPLEHTRRPLRTQEDWRGYAAAPLTIRATRHMQPVKHVSAEGVRLIFVTSGWAHLTTGAGDTDVASGTIVAIPAGVACSARPVGHVDATTLYAHQEFVADQLRWLRGHDPLTHSLRRATTGTPELATLHLGESGARTLSPRLLKVLLASEQGYEDFAFFALVAALLDEAGKLLASRPPDSSIGLPPVPRSEVATAVSLLHARPNHAWTVQELASQVAMSESQLSRLFRSQLHTSPAAFLRRTRTDHMAGLLASGTVNISRAAAAAGWASPSTASRAFRRRYGVSPRQFLEQSRLGSPADQLPQQPPGLSPSRLQASL